MYVKGHQSIKVHYFVTNITTSKTYGYELRSYLFTNAQVRTQITEGLTIYGKNFANV